MITIGQASWGEIDPRDLRQPMPATLRLVNAKKGLYEVEITTEMLEQNPSAEQQKEAILKLSKEQEL